MGFLTDILRSRVLPALVAALGVSFIAAGLLTYTTGTDADLFPFPSDGTAVAPSPNESPAPSASIDIFSSPLPTALPTPIPSGSGTINVLPSPLTSNAPDATPSAAGSANPSASATATSKPKPTPTAAPLVTRVATRVVIPALDIDLPIVKPSGGSTTYPLCNVAMYIQNLAQPGYSGATYLYAHARIGMFLSLLDQSRINNGRGMLGMLVQVYTSDNMYYLYQISEVRRHQLTLADAIAARDQELWLQTSEGPRGTPGKLQVIATPISSGPATAADAHPTPKPIVCG